jgi:hypothetical protein
VAHYLETAMKKINLNETIQTIANICVVLGIVFLALEVQQNTEAVRSATVNSLSEQTYETVRLALENPDIRKAVFAARRNEDLTEDQQQIMNLVFNASLRVRQNRYLQDQFGVLDEDVSSELGSGGIYRMGLFRDYWAVEKDRYSPGFQDYVERVLLPLADED